MNLSQLIIFAFLWFPNFLKADGFLPDTLIKTAADSIAIENLSIDDSIISHDNKTYQPISITSRIVGQYIKICIGDECIRAALDQKFYLPQEQQWVAARKLTLDHCLLKSDDSLIAIDRIEIIKRPAKVYILTLAKGHTFYVSKKKDQ